MSKYVPLLVGNFLEFYDFTLFAYLIPIIAPLLFSSNDLVDSYMVGYIFLAIAFFSRPVGAILFGHIGDKYGRKYAVILSILAMSISTIAISFLPTGRDNLIVILIMLTICRILQGMSAGGEYSGTGLLLVENAKKENQFLNGAILTSTALLGAFVASLSAAILSNSEYSQNGWRVLFFAGGVIGFITLWLRISIKESTPDESEDIITSSDWSILFKHYKTPLFLTILCSALMNVPFQMVTGFLNTYLVATGDFERVTLMFINAFVIFSCAVITLIFGFFTKIVNPINMMVYASGGMALFSFPFFFFIESSSVVAFLGAEIILMLLSQFFVAPAFVVMARLFPFKIRYKGVAIGNCLGLAFLGGGTSYISGYLIKITDISWSPVFYLFFISMLGFIASVLIKKDSISDKMVKPMGEMNLS